MRGGKLCRDYGVDATGVSGRMGKGSGVYGKTACGNEPTFITNMVSHMGWPTLEVCVHPICSSSGVTA